MTTATEVDLQRVYTQEERDAMFEAHCEALARGDYEECDRILEHMPINPDWAKSILKVYGKDYLLANFNITEANRVFGEGWVNG